MKEPVEVPFPLPPPKVVLHFSLSDNPAIMSDGMPHVTPARVTLWDNRGGYIAISDTSDTMFGDMTCHFYWSLDGGKAVVSSDSWRIDVDYLSNRILEEWKKQMMELIIQ